ncbi:MAG: type II 3-dehydroquinate dehydratase [Syntrophomonadaceae bacterium]|jgi:3-dehydroquinate dehydratase-2
MPRILVINGPNLNMLGIREKNIYGQQSLDDINRELQLLADQQSIQVEFFQSNHEGELVDEIQKAYQRVDFIIINPGALTHYSIALLDALKAVDIPYIEVHLSNIYQRETFRQHSLFSSTAQGGIFGLGAYGYKLALLAACDLLRQVPEDDNRLA